MMKNIKIIKQNQKGFAHLSLVVVIVAVVGAVGMAGYTVVSNQNHKREASRLAAEKIAQEEAKKAAELKLKEVEAQQADDKPVEVATPSEIKPAEQIPTTTKPTTTTTSKPKASYIKFSSVEHTFESGTLSVTATLPKAYSGKCKLYMTQGETAYKKPIEISNSNTCSISISASELPSAGNWEWYMYFWTVDGLVNASSTGYTQEF